MSTKKADIASLKLKDTKLFHQQAYINGQWLNAESG